MNSYARAIGIQVKAGQVIYSQHCLGSLRSWLVFRILIHSVKRALKQVQSYLYNHAKNHGIK